MNKENSYRGCANLCRYPCASSESGIQRAAGDLDKISAILIINPRSIGLVYIYIKLKKEQVCSVALRRWGLDLSRQNGAN